MRVLGCVPLVGSSQQQWALSLTLTLFFAARRAAGRAPVQLLVKIRQLPAHPFDIDFHRPYVEVAGSRADEGDPRPIG
jgi:hypothetical protein